MSNGLPLSTAPSRLGYLQPIAAHTPVTLLRERYGTEGYLWLKGLFDRTEILDFRRWFFASFQEYGLLAPDTDPVEGIVRTSAGEDRAATSNENNEGRMRLSTDIRYQRADDAIDERWRNYWSPDDGL
jgi:hypothetical protein